MPKKRPCNTNKRTLILQIRQIMKQEMPQKQTSFVKLEVTTNCLNNMELETAGMQTKDVLWNTTWRPVIH